MEEMGAEKSRPQVIAISAKRTIKNHPECKKYLDRPQQKIKLDEKHWIIWSSKSFRLHRSQPCSIRIFFSKKAPPSTKWKSSLKTILNEKLGIPIGKMGKEQEKDNYLEIIVDNPKLILALLNHRVAGFLD
jgi:hypothetical protein